MSHAAVIGTVVGNIASSVCLVLTNKYVYQSLGLPYAATISSFHYLTGFLFFKLLSLQVRCSAEQAQIVGVIPLWPVLCAIPRLIMFFQKISTVSVNLPVSE